MFLRTPVAVVMILLAGCRKDPPTPSQQDMAVAGPGDVLFRFNCQVNGQSLTDSVLTYTNFAGEQFSVTKFTYYVSNVRLLTAGSGVAETESYHLIQHVERDTSFVWKDVPIGIYTGVEFLLGVDSVRNVSGAQTGALDIANGMFWDWSTGYIYLKLEGDYKSPMQPAGHVYGIHIGGFKAPYSTLQTVRLDFPQPFRVNRKGPVQLVVDVELDQFFKEPKQISFDYYYSNISEKTFQDISINYKDMFTLKSVSY